jgi:hypothetical protein
MAFATKPMSLCVLLLALAMAFEFHATMANDIDPWKAPPPSKRMELIPLQCQ